MTDRDAHIIGEAAKDLGDLIGASELHSALLKGIQQKLASLLVKHGPESTVTDVSGKGQPAQD